VKGFSLVETMAAVTIAATVSGIAVPVLMGNREQYRASGAARHLAAVVFECRSQAIRSGAYVAMRFADDGSTTWTMFQDGNGDGVKSADITRGIDRQVGPAIRLKDSFPEVRFGLVSGVTDIESGQALTGSGIRLGAGNWLSFSPVGTTSSGTLYVRGNGNAQYAVRVFGATGRVRVLRFNAVSRTWELP
jgi:prepilin-type N-terminal cleavage/methylation domain-containing protein